MFLVLQQLCIFFGLSSAASIASSTALSSTSFLCLGLLCILSVDLSHDVANLGVWVCLDEVAEEIRQAEKIAESANGIIFLGGGCRVSATGR